MRSKIIGIVASIILSGCNSEMEKSEQEPKVEWMAGAVELCKLNESPKGYLRLKTYMQGPDDEPTDLLDFHPSGKYLMSSSSSSGKIRIWDVTTGQSKASLTKSELANRVVYSPGGNYLFVDYYRKPNDMTPYKILYDTDNYQISYIEELKNGGRPTISALNPVTSDLYLMNGSSRTIKEYPNIRRYKLDNNGFTEMDKSGRQLYDFNGAYAWSGDGRYIAVSSTDHGKPGVGDEDQFVGIWDTQTLKEVRRINKVYPVPKAYAVEIRAIAWSGDGKYLVLGSNGSGKQLTKNQHTGELMEFENLSIPIQVRDARTGELIKKITAHRPGYGIDQIIFFNDQVFVTLERASRTGAYIAMWSVSSEEMLELYQVPKVNGRPNIAWHAASSTLAVSAGRVIQTYVVDLDQVMADLKQ